MVHTDQICVGIKAFERVIVGSAPRSSNLIFVSILDLHGTTNQWIDGRLVGEAQGFEFCQQRRQFFLRIGIHVGYDLNLNNQWPLMLVAVTRAKMDCL